MDILLFSLGLVCMFLGIIGSFLPVIPGPLCSWAGLLLLYLTSVPTDFWVLAVTFAIMVVITVLDYVIPAKGTKHFGGSKYGIWGTNIGLIVGIFVPIPFGVVIGPFLGALIGELIYNSTDHKRAFKAATGSFIGFLASAFVQFVTCIGFLGLFLWIAWKHRLLLF